MSKKELLFSLTKKDFRIDFFCSGGPGGQHQNKTASGARITHIESGAVGESREHRSQHQNKAEAFQRLMKSGKFKLWHSRKVLEMTRGKSIEKQVEEAMNPKNIKVEVKTDKNWVPYQELTEELEDM